MMALVLVLLVACAPPAYRYPLPEVPVRITRWPERPVIDCYVEHIPATLPEPRPWPEGVDADRDVFRRHMVGKREHDALLAHVKDLNSVIESMRVCLMKVMETGK